MRTDINNGSFYEGTGSAIKGLARLRSIDGMVGWKLRQEKMLQPWGRILSFPETSSFAGRPPTAWRSLTHHIPGTDARLHSLGRAEYAPLDEHVSVWGI